MTVLAFFLGGDSEGGKNWAAGDVVLELCGSGTVSVILKMIVHGIAATEAPGPRARFLRWAGGSEYAP